MGGTECPCLFSFLKIYRTSYMTKPLVSVRRRNGCHGVARLWRFYGDRIVPKCFTVSGEKVKFAPYYIYTYSIHISI